MKKISYLYFAKKKSQINRFTPITLIYDRYRRPT